MTDDDKKRIAEYMGWKYRRDLWGGIEYFRDRTDGFEQYYIVHFDPNDATLCVAEMQKRGDWQKFCATGFVIYFEKERPSHVFPENYIAWLFNAENFFNVMSEWLKEGKK